MVRIAVHGSYFVNNFGDTLLVRMLCDRVAEQVGRENVFLATRGHSAEQASIGYPVVAPEDRKDIDLLLYSGGGYFGDAADSLYERFTAARRRHLRHFSWLDGYRDAARAVIGVGVGPIGFQRQSVRDLFASSRAVLVRDAESLAYCRSYGFALDNLRQCVDMALSLDPVGPEGRSGVALHVPGMPKRHLETLFQVLADAPAWRRAERIEVIYDTPTGPDAAEFQAGLQAVAHAVFGRALPIRAYPGLDPMLEALHGYELVVTNKLHVGIVTIAKGGRVLSTPHHIKTPRLYRQLGLSDYCLPLSSLSAADLAAAVEKLPDFAPDRAEIAAGLEVIETTIAQVLDSLARPDAAPAAALAL